MGKKNKIVKKTEENLLEIQRRHTVAQLHQAGTEIQKEEMERIKMTAKILLGRTKSLYDNIKTREPMTKRVFENIEKYEEANTEDEKDYRFARGVTDFAEDAFAFSIIQPEVDNIVIAANQMVKQLEKNGINFTFPEFISYPGLAGWKITLEGIIGFLTGVAEV